MELDSGEARAKVLYLTYDGLTDPLGRSQVLPYLEALTARGHQIHVVSCEKPNNYSSAGELLARYLGGVGIGWTPLVYHKRPPILSTVWDVAAMYRSARSLHKRSRFHLIHCRSYPPALAGLGLKLRHRCKLLFDIRGFWADEKVDGMAWDRSRAIYNAVYLFFKRMERVLLTHSDMVVSLTYAAKEEMLRWRLPQLTPEKIAVIPCCADLKHFDRTAVSDEARERLYQELKMSPNDFILTYVGSLGSWYRLDDMLAFFKALLQSRPNAKFLFITREPASIVLERLQVASVPVESVRVYSASREELPVALSLAQLGIYFRKAVYSAIACSPTKLAEMLGMGLPVVTSPGIGDSEALVESCDVGPLAHTFTAEQYEKILSDAPDYLSRPASYYRNVAEQHFTLEEGVRRYSEIYEGLVCQNP